MSHLKILDFYISLWKKVYYVSIFWEFYIYFKEFKFLIWKKAGWGLFFITFSLNSALTKVSLVSIIIGWSSSSLEVLFWWSHLLMSIFWKSTSESIPRFSHLSLDSIFISDFSKCSANPHFSRFDEFEFSAICCFCKNIINTLLKNLLLFFWAASDRSGQSFRLDFLSI